MLIQKSIVFVHGFTGHPEQTWTHKKGEFKYRHQCEHCLCSEPALKKQKTNLLPKSRGTEGSSHNQIYWPRDLLPKTIQNARILTYGYDTHIKRPFGPPTSSSTVYDMSSNFLVHLDTERRSNASRPLLFVVHSLGGILVKEALRQAVSRRSQHVRLSETFRSTIGIIFFGTPHNGADPLDLPHRILKKLAEAAQFSVNENVANSLLPSSDLLRRLRDEFHPVALEQNWDIHSFQEEIGVSFLNNRKVQRKLSSIEHLTY